MKNGIVQSQIAGGQCTLREEVTKVFMMDLMIIPEFLCVLQK